MIKFTFVAGIIKSSLPKEIPALNACLNPSDFILSQNKTVSFWPQNRKIVSITSETFFFAKSLSINVNLILWCFGKTLANKNLPAVLVYFWFTFLPFSSTVSKTDTIFECKLIDLSSIAWPISSILENIPLGFSSFLSSDCER